MNIQKEVKEFIKEILPPSILEPIRRFLYNRKSVKWRFSEIYDKYAFNSGLGEQAPRSGPGSDLIQTRIIREEIPKLIKELNAKSLLDAPCGDLTWIKEIDLGLDRYIGVDVVSELITDNQEKYSKGREFIELDIIEDDLPQADIILCRDCLVHSSYKHISSIIKNFKKSRSKYLLTTTYDDQSIKNKNIITGGWRRINLELPPFNFPKPIKLINEGCTEGDGKESKCLGLWKLEDL